MRSVGFAVRVYASAEEFLNSNDRQKTDCLILDVFMPGMDGFELQRRLSAGQHNIPVIFITARGDEEARQLALSAGAVDYLMKPLSEEALLNAVQRALKK